MTDSLTLNNISSVSDYIKETRLLNIRWLYWAKSVGHENFSHGLRFNRRDCRIPHLRECSSTVASTAFVTLLDGSV